VSKRTIRVCLGLLAAAAVLAGMHVKFPLGWPPARAALAPSDAAVSAQLAAPGEVSGTVSVEARLLQDGAEGLLSVEVRTAARAALRAEPIALCVLLDTSGSMKGERKLADALAAIGELAGRLAPEDELAIVSYANLASVALPLRAGHDPSAVRSALAGIRAGGATNLSAALRLGERLLADSPKRRHLMLLSDGMPNRGLTDKRELGRLGAHLRARGITLSALGLGVHFDERLLSALAGAGGGDYAYCRNGDVLAATLSRQLVRAQGMAAADVTVSIELPPGVRPAHFYGRSLELSGSTLIYRLGDLPAAERRDLLIRIAPLQAPVGLTLSYGDLLRGPLAGEVRERWQVEAPHAELREDARAQAKLEMALGCSALPRALGLRSSGQTAAAARLLDERIDALERTRDAALWPLVEPALQGLREMRAGLGAAAPGSAAMRDLEIRSALLTRDCR
jgi:Ca-activated chloride channel homolog